MERLPRAAAGQSSEWCRAGHGGAAGGRDTHLGLGLRREGLGRPLGQVEIERPVRRQRRAADQLGDRRLAGGGPHHGGLRREGEGAEEKEVVAAEPVVAIGAEEERAATW